MRIFTQDEFEQGSEEWLAVRGKIPTASQFHAVMAKGQGKTRRTYMLKLIGQRITGQPAESFSNSHTDRGHKLEPEACSMYEFQSGNEVNHVAFILGDNDAGCSPDGLIGDDGMLEIKTKLPHLQIETLIADVLPSEHKAQVQGSLWVSGREWCDFVSYWPKLPPFIKRVYRDEKYIDELAESVKIFNEEMNELEQKIRSM